MNSVVTAAGLYGCFFVMVVTGADAAPPTLRDSTPPRSDKRLERRDPGANLPLGCHADVDCNDHDPCTIDLCSDGACVHTPIPACKPGCRADSDCSDGDPCTEDVCVDGLCEGRPIEGCQRPCQDDSDCDDGDGCTQDLCDEGFCMHNDIPGCVPCDPNLICPPLDIVFVMDTSGSMKDEADALCDKIRPVVDDLLAEGVAVTPYLLGITETPGFAFWCLTDNVVNLLGDTVPGAPGDCLFPDGVAPNESWGPATAIVADRFDWTERSIRVIVPMSDEGPCNGSLPDGCNDPGDDRDSIDNAIGIAHDNQVIVSPITGNGADACVIALAESLAAGTGGTSFEIQDPYQELVDDLRTVLLDACETAEQCDDTNVCTDDYCDEQEGVCRFDPNFDESVYCCDPQEGTLTPIDDGNVCTDDYCDPETGEVTHPPTEPGTSCTDDDPCTVMDECDDEGHCVGTDITTVPCVSNEECFGYDCDTDTGYCVCEKTHTLCLVVEPSPEADEDCYRVGEELTVNIELGFGTPVVTGGQFLVPYDPEQLQAISLVPGSEVDPGSPFSNLFYQEIDGEAGLIFFAIGIELGGVGTQGPAIMAAVRFMPLEPCSQVELCFANENPRNTLLIDELGQPAPYEPDCCTDPLRIDDGEPTIECPESVEVDPAPGHLDATVTWDPITLTDGCDGEVTRVCTATHSHGVDISDLIEGGGTFPSGLAEFECVATDSCGYQATCRWHVLVSTMNTLRTEIHLSPEIVDDALLRCIEFELFSSCMEDPEVTERTIEFGGPFNLPGHAKGVEFEIPAGQYYCLTARDPLHTLRSVADVDPQNDEYIAIFKGDPYFGGNWLIGGNLDGNRVIDVLDVATYMDESLTTVDPDTPCGTRGPHADINGDGLVDQFDWSFIQTNWLSADRESCCPDHTAAEPPTPITDISVKELARMGLGHLDVADLNHDGRVNSEDIAAYMNGVRPSRREEPRDAPTRIGLEGA